MTKKIAPITIEQCIERLRDKATDANYCEIEGLLTWSAKYLQHQHNLLKEFHEVCDNLDYEYCTVLNNYFLEPIHPNTPRQYRIPKEYDSIWMEKFIEVEEYLGIE